MFKEPDVSAPWKQRFRARSVFMSSIAPRAPKRGLVVSNPTGVFQLHAWDLRSGHLIQLTDQPEGKMFGTLAPDGEHVYYLHDRQGDEIGHFVRVPFRGGDPVDITPKLPSYSPTGFAISRLGNVIGLTAGTQEGFHLYIAKVGLDGEIGAPELLHVSKVLMRGPILSHSGEIACMASTARSGKFQFSLLAFDTHTGKQIEELSDGEGSSLEPVCFSTVAGDTRLLATTNRTGTETLLIWDPRTGERSDFSFSEVEGAITAFDWSADGRQILFSAFDQAVQQLYVYDLRGGKLRRLDHPSGSTVTPPYFGPDGEILAQWQTATQPSQVVALDGATGELARVLLGAGDVPTCRPWQSVAFPSSDGQEIQGWLAVPEGGGPFPTILDTHGGPSGVQEEEFSAGCQAWLDHGFAYLTINYRGSTTFGREFQEKILGDLGHWEVEDMAAARDWLVGKGIAHASQVLLSGWSYGGYLTLQALGKRPELWAGGMAGTAIADWVIQYEDSAEALRGYQVSLFGGTPEERPTAYTASSPIAYVEKVQAPVLIIQGRNDTRTPARPIEMYEARMKTLGKPIQVHWFESGHMGPYAQAEQAIKHQEIMLRFASDVLKEQS